MAVRSRAVDACIVNIMNGERLLAPVPTILLISLTKSKPVSHPTPSPSMQVHRVFHTASWTQCVY